MPSRPSPELAEHPDFEDVLRRACRKQGLDEYLEEPVRRLVTGRADPHGFQCCNTGCSPCVKDYLRAAETVLTSLDAAVVRGKRRRWWRLWLR